MAASATQVVVDGDVTVDWSLARGLWAGEAIRHGGAGVSHQAGGAALLAELVAQAVGRSWEGVVRPPFPDTVSPGDLGLHHSWAQWSQSRGSGEGWWVERILGVTRAARDAPMKRLES